jgi:hypothetical protein
VSLASQIAAEFWRQEREDRERERETRTVRTWGGREFTYTPKRNEERDHMLNVTKEVKATLTATTGRVIAWHNDKERGAISIAVPGDRAKLSPVQARNLAAWLIKEANAIEEVDVAARSSVPRWTTGVRY